MRVATRLLPTALLAAGLAGSAQADTTEALSKGMEAWNRRWVGHRGPRADPARIEEAVTAYQSALDADPENLAARVGLIKALYFLGEHALEDRDTRLRVFERGCRLAEDGIDQLGHGYEGDPRPSLRNEPVPESLIEHLSKTPEARGVYLWGSIQWGLWGRERGKIASAREGVAAKIRDYASVVIALDERYENAGGHRVLGRLHSEAPRLPFFTGWIDREVAIESLERAVELAPNDLLSQLYLFEALLLYDRSRRTEAVDGLRRLITQKPNPDYLVEELQALADARALLDRLQQ